MNRLAVVFPFLVLACTNSQHGLYSGNPDASQVPLDDAGNPIPQDATDAMMMPATCNGYEPCGVSAVVLPTGYTLRNYVISTFMSSGAIGQFDCSTGTCTMGGFQLSNFVGSDNSQSPQVEVSCP